MRADAFVKLSIVDKLQPFHDFTLSLYQSQVGKTYAGLSLLGIWFTWLRYHYGFE